MKNLQKCFPPKISSLIFVIQPLFLSFNAPSFQAYFLQFDKGAQIIKRFQEKIVITPTHPTHRFSTSAQPIKLRLPSQTNMNFEWQIYKMVNKVSEFVNCIPVILDQYYDEYIESLNKLRKQYQKAVEDMVKGELTIKEWEKIKKNIRWEFPYIVSKNLTFDIEITFRLEIWNQIDLLLEKSGDKSTSNLNLQSNENMKQAEQFEEQEDFQDFPQNLILNKQSSSQNQKYIPKKKHFQPITMLKRSSGLSQIIQCSNQCSSVLNYNQRHAQLEQISGIPEEQAEQSPYIHEGKGEVFRRSNTLDSNLYNFPQMTNRSRKVSTPQRQSSQYGDKYDITSKMETQPQSLVEDDAKEKMANRFKINPKIAVAILLLLLLIGFFVYQNGNNGKATKKTIKKPTKKLSKAQPPSHKVQKNKLSNKK